MFGRLWWHKGQYILPGQVSQASTGAEYCLVGNTGSNGSTENLGQGADWDLLLDPCGQCSSSIGTKYGCLPGLGITESVKGNCTTGCPESVCDKSQTHLGGLQQNTRLAI